MIAFDTNILAYAQQEVLADVRHQQASDLIDRGMDAGAIIPVQVLSEFMNVCKRKLAIAPLDTVSQVQDYLDVFDCPQTTATDVTEAAMLAELMKLSYFDALILTVAQRNGTTIFLSEDMHDGLEVDGLRIVNPFVAANDALLADYFGPAF